MAREQETYKEWTVLGQVDLDSFVGSHVVTAQEFEDNFKAVRARRREAEKLPEIIKVKKKQRHTYMNVFSRKRYDNPPGQ